MSRGGFCLEVCPQVWLGRAQLPGLGIGWCRQWLQKWVRSEVGSEGGTLGKLGLQRLVEKRHPRAESGAAAEEEGGHYKGWVWVDRIMGIIGGSC